MATVVRDDRAHLRITQQPVELLGDLVRPGRAPPTVLPRYEQRRETHPEPHPLKHSHRQLEVRLVSSVEWTGQRRDDHKVSGY